MARRLPADASDANTRKASDKESLADLKAAALFIASFSEREKLILKAWVTALCNPKVAGALADCSEKQVYNTLRKVRKALDRLSNGKLGTTVGRYDKRKGRRILIKGLHSKVDAILLKDFDADPLGTARRYIVRKKAAQGPSTLASRIREFVRRKRVTEQGQAPPAS